MTKTVKQADYKNYMKKYKLRLNTSVDGKYKPKSMKVMSRELYDHETNNGINDGLYYYTASDTEEASDEIE